MKHLFQQLNVRAVIWAITIVVGLPSCSSPSAIDTALQKAGKNRQEIEKVLEYFSRVPEDSLKYKAARFLIENMPGHT